MDDPVRGVPRARQQGDAAGPAPRVPRARRARRRAAGGGRAWGPSCEALEATLGDRPPRPGSRRLPESGGAAARARRETDRRPEEWVGKVFGGQYEVRRVIGEGGFGAVLGGLRPRAPDRRSRSRSCGRRPCARRRTSRTSSKEAQRVTQLQHPNIVEWKVLAKTRDGTPYFVMEFLEGEELEDLLAREGRLPWRRCAGDHVPGPLRPARRAPLGRRQLGPAPGPQAEEHLPDQEPARGRDRSKMNLTARAVPTQVTSTPMVRRRLITRGALR